jgi:hypothetical protein
MSERVEGGKVVFECTGEATTEPRFVPTRYQGFLVMFLACGVCRRPLARVLPSKPETAAELGDIESYACIAEGCPERHLIVGFAGDLPDFFIAEAEDGLVEGLVPMMGSPDKARPH